MIALMDLIERDSILYHKQLEACGNGMYREVEVAYKTDIDSMVSTIVINNDITKVVVYDEEYTPVVRCKDCRRRDLFSCPLADNDFQKDDDFCSWGERKGGDTK